MKPTVRLVGEDGNAFSILGRCKKASRAAGWTKEQWEEFEKKAMDGDYDHLISTVMEYFAEEGEGESGEDDNVVGDYEECEYCGCDHREDEACSLTYNDGKD